MKRRMVYIASRPSPDPFTVRVSGIRKKELEKLVGHKVISVKDGYDWDFLIPDDDAVRLGLLTEKQKYVRRAEKGVPYAEVRMYYWDGTELKKKEG